MSDDLVARLVPELVVVVVDHGSRLAAASEAFAQVTELVAQQLRRQLPLMRTRVRLAHMELAEPLLADVLREELQSDGGMLIVQPYFLFPGRHAEHDIPNIVRLAAQAAGTGRDIRIAQPLGVHDLLAELATLRTLQALEPG